MSLDARRIEPDYSKKRVKKAGVNIANGVATEEDFDVLDNWRRAHNKILNDWQATLRKRVETLTKSKQINKVLFAQRQKRKVTICDKLKRHPSMSLARMQDIAGCRLIFENAEDIENFRKTLINRRSFEHVLIRDQNYIKTPKDDGYRGVHEVWRYQAKRRSKGHAWNGMEIEIQYRTKIQHLWATAVEIADLMEATRVKFGEGGKDKKAFFSLSSEILSRAFEGENSCHPNMSSSELLSKFEQVNNKTNLINKLKAFKVVSRGLSGRKFVKGGIILHYKKDFVDVKVSSNFKEAQDRYFQLEKEIEAADDLVLVRVKSSKDLRLAYKNYFGNSKDFVGLLEDGCDKLRRG